MDFLHADQFEVMVYQAVTQSVFDLMDRRDENLAIRIANAVAKAFNSNG